MTGEVARYADVAMYRAIPTGAAGQRVRPRVSLVHMTPDPLRVMAAAAQMYRGLPVQSPHYGVTVDEAMQWFEDMTRTRLQAPLEFIDLHFLIEGVTRAFTHQLVRQRTAVYVQESQRFAVKDNAAWEVAEPPSLDGLPDDHPWRVRWADTVAAISHAYNQLVDSGMPAEDARGLLPTNITTRIHYKTNLRNLAEHAGNRLCTQAQFEWRVVWALMIQAIRQYGPAREHWQQEMIAGLFKPICFSTGKCEFMAASDRHCDIRDRVTAHHFRSESPDTWNDIRPSDWMVPWAARKKPGEE